ncbi:MAG: hypothetical protein HC895_03510 [Leptolyngbyaceae cyanobacterium SM1_3_5]|nr:hypothetical protein [Leptolyngbyaceae cyanobacterium SM1_3_5]
MAVLFGFVLLSLLFINAVIELPIDLLNLLHPSRWLVCTIALVILAWCLDDR